MKYRKEDVVVLDENRLQEYQAELLSVAKDVISVMDKYNLQYSLSGGSILGAIRHKGFIPWDDDVDLNVPRKSYDKLLQVFEEELGNRYYVQTPQKNPEIGIMVTQIRKRGTVARRKYDWRLSECGISIDIYIVENVFDNFIARVVQKNLSMFFSFCISAIRFYNNCHLPKELYEMEGRQPQYTKIKLILARFLKIVPLRKWISWCNYWNSACKNEYTKLVAIPTGRKHFSGEIYERNKMNIYKKVPFETELFNVPIWAEGFLEKFYGDYMEIPPVEKRERHLFLELRF